MITHDYTPGPSRKINPISYLFPLHGAQRGNQPHGESSAYTAHCLCSDSDYHLCWLDCPQPHADKPGLVAADKKNLILHHSSTISTLSGSLAVSQCGVMGVQCVGALIEGGHEVAWQLNRWARCGKGHVLSTEVWRCVCVCAVRIKGIIQHFGSILSYQVSIENINTTLTSICSVHKDGCSLHYVTHLSIMLRSLN